MLFVGDHTTIFDSSGTPYIPKVYNLSSPLEGFPRLNIMPGPNLILTEDNQREFDIAYANQIMSCGICEMMKIMLPIYNGEDIYLLVYKDNGGYYDAVTESILKFIQHRYGIIGIVINDLCDYDVTPTQYNTSFSLPGLFNFDQDKEIYTRELAKGAINGGITTLPEGQLY